MISSPCVKKCLVDMDYLMCMGCGRTLRHIETWEELTEEYRREIMAVLPFSLKYYKDKKAEKNTFDISRLIYNHK